MARSASFLMLCLFVCGLQACQQGNTAALQDPGFAPEKNLQKLGVTLTVPDKPVANYVRAVTTGNLVFLAGHIPRDANGKLMTGKVGADVDLATAQEAAKRCAISLLSSLKAEIGDLRRVQRIVKVTGMVNATEDFSDHSKVVNGCSDFLVSVFGDRGKHARAAVGMSSLPLNCMTEIEMIVEIK